MFVDGGDEDGWEGGIGCAGGDPVFGGDVIEIHLHPLTIHGK